MTEYHVMHEITPLDDGSDILYIVERYKKEFDYPIHNHECYELNFVEHAAGVRRIVGDSAEIIGDYDLALITSHDLEHVWEQYQCKSERVREITIQFAFDEDDFLLMKAPFAAIRHMMKEAKKGMAFSMPAIMKVYNDLTRLAKITDKFEAISVFFTILNTLATTDGAHTLATSSYAKVQIEDDSKRILKVKNYINENYMYELKLETLADLANMSQSSFSRFFKLHTSRTLSDYIIDIRLGNATRMLLNTQESISNISFNCGYNNLSNFNRIFKRKKGCSPTEFREQYRKIKRVI